MTANSLRIAISGLGSNLNYASSWVRLEQIIPDEIKNFANVADIYNLWMAAATGKSARMLRPDNCPVEFDGDEVHAFLGFYIWSSRENLPYTLTVAMGTISEQRAVRMQKEFSVFIDNASRYALPYNMSGVVAFWETPTYNALGEQIPPPTITHVSGIWLVFSTPVFGALRIMGTAIGTSIVVEMVFKKGIDVLPVPAGYIETWQRGPGGELILTPAPANQLTSYKISDIKNRLTVAWSTGGDAIAMSDVVATSITTEGLDIELPQCLQDVLNFCPGMFDTINLWCGGGGSDAEKTKKIYYNACNGQKLGEEIGDTVSNKSRFCTKAVAPPLSATSWLPEDWR